MFEFCTGRQALFFVKGLHFRNISLLLFIIWNLGHFSKNIRTCGVESTFGETTSEASVGML